MFNVTRLAAQVTKIERRVVKNIAKERIDLSKASSDFRSNAKTIQDECAPYAKNIFKRAVVWVNSFVRNFKELKEDVKGALIKKRHELGEAFDKKAAKSATKEFIANTKAQINEVKDELKELLKK